MLSALQHNTDLIFICTTTLNELATIIIPTVHIM